MMSWLRCFPHDGAVMDDEPAISRPRPRPGRSATFRKIKHTTSNCAHAAAAAAHRKRFIRTSTMVTDAPGRHSVDGASGAGGYNHSVVSARSFTFRELAAATNSFSQANLLGEGGFGRVYRGLVGGTAVAVKQLDRTGYQGDHEFLVEVLMLSGLLSHPNLVGLLGYCADGNQRLLVYRLMPLGSLEKHLFVNAPDADSPPPPPVLPWRARMRIAHGAAEGLEFLHETANPPVIYRDFKSSNILLDQGYQARLSDFGLAKLAASTTTGAPHYGGGEEKAEEAEVIIKESSSRVMGTYGYCAPEYVRTGHLTVKSDVYSFGVVLLELITGRRVIDDSRPEGEQNLVAWAAHVRGAEEAAGPGRPAATPRRRGAAVRQGAQAGRGGGGHVPAGGGHRAAHHVRRRHGAELPRHRGRRPVCRVCSEMTPFFHCITIPLYHYTHLTALAHTTCVVCI